LLEIREVSLPVARRSAFRRDPGLWRLKALLLGLLLARPVLAEPLPEVVVVASALREAPLATVPASITVLDPTTIQRASVQNFEELVPLIPNVNWSGDGSRARYFQIRGTGELEQYEGAPNPSVGFIVDDIDLSGLGGVATTFDVGRIEVLRGPQGTRYGANALAGLIYVETGQPTAEAGAEVVATSSSDNTWAVGGVARGTVPGLDEELTYRVAVQQYRADGFIHNAFLGRDDTSGQDELTARAKLRWKPSTDITVQLTAFHVNLDNGYDDFNLANNFTTYSDQPGEDSQRTDAAALRATFGVGALADLVSITGVASSDIVYSFDADWGNPGFWAPYVYNFTARQTRQRDTVNQELRLISRPGSTVLGADWLVGLYALNLREDVAQRDTANCDVDTCGEEFVDPLPVLSHYEATNLASYAELGWALDPATRLTAGLRWEVRDAKFRTGDHRLDPFDRMVGGDVTLTHTVVVRGVTEANLWARVARGYKAGGFNPSVFNPNLAGIPGVPERLQFRPEYLWNYEVGARATGADQHWWASASVFLQQRDDLQLKIPEQLRVGDPNTFLFFTQNAEQGRATGLELELGWRPLAPLEFGAAFGLLDTEITRFSARRELEGRPLAHAPRYTFAVNGTWRSGGGWFARLDYGGKGGYVIDYCQVDACNEPDAKTSAYQLLGLRAGREWGGWSVEAWCRNVLDKDYAVRGFYFGNEPPDFTPTLYTRLGDPRQAGLTLSRRFE
jgi:outer membrane receptor protein involved in Fe transport